MNKHTITFEGLNLIMNRKSFFTKERFSNYFLIEKSEEETEGEAE
jgi:hypothetical protein